MANLGERSLDRVILEAVGDRGLPLLGICLGMQLLATRGLEGGDTPGLGLVEGEVRLLPAGREGLRLPHIGWNEVRPGGGSPLFEEVVPGTDFYFVHSYHFVCAREENVLARTAYGVQFASAVGRGTVFGVQFHPEKSQRPGFQVLRNFLALTGGPC
jgi:glutamine amidotransferase